MQRLISAAVQRRKIEQVLSNPGIVDVTVARPGKYAPGRARICHRRTVTSCSGGLVADPG
jgi:hypothetical protein